MSILFSIGLAIQLLVGFYLVFPLVLLLLFVFRKRRDAGLTLQREEADYAIIVTAYGQTLQVPDAVASLLSLSYSNYTIYVVADNCDASGLVFADNRVVILQPEEVLSSNTRSHFYAINRFVRPHERVLIIDSDNLVDRKLILELNHFFDRGFQAVQGLREAKNLDTTYARLDAARDIYYHFYDGMILFGAGSSATLSGSGMAFTVSLYKECIEHQDVTGAGFDKVLQSAIVRKNLRIAFAEKAVVFDEKTTASGQLVSQRARWIHTWIRYFSFGFGLIGKGILNRSLNQLLFGLILLRPPLFMFLGFSVMCMILNIFLYPLAAFAWLSGMILFVGGFLGALTYMKADQRIFKSLYGIPLFVFYQVIALFKSIGSGKLTVATRQGDVKEN